MEVKRDKLLSEVADHVVETAIDCGCRAEQAEQFCLTVANFLAEHFTDRTSRSHATIYKPALCDLQIDNEHKSHNWAELS
ncbi:MAG: Mor transcription activator family protein [Candidatus Malihini olakiniferum]